MSRSKAIPRSRSNKRKKKKTSFLPEKAQAFIARRLFDMIATLCVITGLFTLIALLTYNSADPSFNSAAGDIQNIQNWGGKTGAHIADSLLQTIGGAAFIVAIIPLIWGVRLFTRQTIRPFILRIILLGMSGIFASIALSQTPSGDYLTHPYMGGSIGSLTMEKLLSFKFEYNNLAIISLSSIIAFTSAIFAAATPRSEITFALSFLRNILQFITGFTLASLIRFKDWIAHYNDPTYQPESLFPKFKMPQIIPNLKKPTEWYNKEETPKTPPINYQKEYVDPPKSKHTDEDNRSFAQKRATFQGEDHKSIPVVKPKTANDGSKAINNQQRFALSESGEWELPPLDLLEAAPPASKTGQLDEKALQRNAELLQNVLADYGIEGDIVSIHPGPVVTLYELEPAPGTKSAKVISLSDDIARSMAAVSVRCAVVPGRNVIGIELPNKNRQIVHMQELLNSDTIDKSKAGLPLALGKDISGQPIIADLAKMPHLLVAGTTGSGKSVAVNTMILSLLYRLPPEKCRFIMIDPKMLELSVYDDIPHLLSPVVTEPGKAIVALKWAVNEMEERYRAMSKMGVRNVDGYNARMREAVKNGETIINKVQTGFDPATGKAEYEDVEMDLTELPYIVIIVDEFADLMLVAGKDVENAIQRLAQMARAAGIHLIMATQRPSVDVITGVVKANFPTRISFQVTSKIDSRTILGEGGAEQLLGMGDMLYMAPGGKIKRVHGPFVSDEDVEQIVNFLKSQGEPSYITDVTEGGEYDSEVMNAMFGEDGSGEKVDELYDEAVAIIAREGKASTSFIQRHLQIGYNRAARIIEEMERQGVISPANATGKRTVLVSDMSGAA